MYDHSWREGGREGGIRLGVKEREGRRKKEISKNHVLLQATLTTRCIRGGTNFVSRATPMTPVIPPSDR